jgi:hypothetical protein
MCILEKSAVENSTLSFKLNRFTVYLENKTANLLFINYQLAQISCINQILVDDYDKDGNLDLLITGMYNLEVETPRNDVLEKGYFKRRWTYKFKSLSATKKGFYNSGDVKDMVVIKVRNQKHILLTKNNSLQTVNEVK